MLIEEDDLSGGTMMSHYSLFCYCFVFLQRSFYLLVCLKSYTCSRQKSKKIQIEPE